MFRIWRLLSHVLALALVFGASGPVVVAQEGDEPQAIRAEEVASPAIPPDCPPPGAPLAGPDGQPLSLPPHCLAYYQSLTIEQGRPAPQAAPYPRPADCPTEPVWVQTASGGVELQRPECYPPEVRYRLSAFTTASDAESPQATGGPDDYGYVWDDTIPFNWIDATVGTDTGLSQGGWSASLSAAIPLGFNFKFYDKTHSNIYISTAGAVGFNASSLSDYTYAFAVPSTSNPNDFIAPYLAPLRVNSGSYTGRVYYLRGGVAPNRYMVVEWYQAQDDIMGSFTFQTVLHENGNIDFSYQSMTHGMYPHCGTVAGIENADGTDGLAYRQSGCNFMNTATGRTVRFTRPVPSARLALLSSTYQGQFTRPGATTSFPLIIRNIGELGADTYDVSVSSPWSVSFFTADGAPLADTNGNGQVDTGAVAQGANFTMTVSVRAPAGAAVGAHNVADITLKSALNPSKTKTAKLQTAVPTSFAQVFRSDYGGMSLYLAQPDVKILKTAPRYGYNIAVAEAPNGNFVSVWERRDYSTFFYADVEYALFNDVGEAIGSWRILTSNGSSPRPVSDGDPSIAIAPDGSIGILWYRRTYSDTTYSQSHSNIYFAVLNPAGNVSVAPINLTNNTTFGSWSDLNIPRVSSPRIAATGDNRFVLAWQQEVPEVGGYVNDIYTAVRTTTGTQVQPPTRLTNDMAGYDDGYFSPNLTPLSSNRALLALERGSSYGNVMFAVLDSDGAIVQALTMLSTPGYDYRPDAIQLSDGRIVVAWTEFTPISESVRYAVLNTNYTLNAGPVTLENPVTPRNYAVSVTADAAGRAVLTWMDGDWRNQRRLYYAMVDGNGSVLTPPTIFQTASSWLETNYSGYGNTTYTPAARFISNPPPTRFVRILGATDFPVTVWNVGGLGADRFNITASAPTWSVSLLGPNGAPLTDTNADGKVDTGALAMGDTFTATLRVQPPAGAAVGASDVVSLNLASSLNASKSKAYSLRFAIPTSFAQVYKDGTQGSLAADLILPNFQATTRVSPTGSDQDNRYEVAVAALPNNNLFYAWQRNRQNSNLVWVNEIEYTRLDVLGRVIQPMTKLTDHSLATSSTYDYLPAVAVAPNGSVGVLWYRQIYSGTTSQFNSNVFFAVLDAGGNVSVAPTNITGNVLFGDWSALNVPSFYSPRIAATSDNRFVLSWNRGHREATGYVQNVYYSVRGTDGAVIKDITQLTATGNVRLHSGNTLAGDRALLTWERGYTIYFAVLDSAGNIVKGETAISLTGQGRWMSDAAALPDGDTFVAWINYDGSVPDKDQLAFAILDSAYNRIVGPNTLNNSDVSNNYLSVTADPAGRVVLTWMESTWPTRPNLYYALMEGNGGSVTPAMVFRTSQSTPAYIETSYAGYGNTSYGFGIPVTGLPPVVYLPLIRR